MGVFVFLKNSGLDSKKNSAAPQSDLSTRAHNAIAIVIVTTYSEFIFHALLIQARLCVSSEETASSKKTSSAFSACARSEHNGASAEGARQSCELC